MDNTQIWNLYFLTEDEVEYSPLIEQYQNKIIFRKGEVTKNRNKLKKFALVSLFPLYRKCNHIGIPMSLEYGESFSSLEKERLAKLKTIFGVDITCTKGYLRLLNFKQIHMFFPSSFLSKKLLNYVLR